MSIISLKSAFLHSQINGLLLQPLSLDEREIEAIALDLTASTVQDAIDEVNRLLQRHVASAYFPLAIRSVAQQIDQLYWEEAAPEKHEDEDPDALRLSHDLASPEGLALLPPEMPHVPGFAKRLQRLQTLHEKREQLQAKLQEVYRLQQLVAPFAQPQVTIQPNLATRDGLLAEELAKTRVLSNRLRTVVAQKGIQRAAQG